MALKVVIGLEMHCELKSNSKVFSSSKNSYEKDANVNISAIDLAFPGVLPVLNKECVRKSLMMSIALNCSLPEYIYFDRKNYYYPDLPKGYQITQSHDPVGVNGEVIIECNKEERKIKIHDIHLEEDTASLDHVFDSSFIDYNRAGVPLLELVTEPCIYSADEAVAFLEHIKRIYQYCDISDADSKKGQIRCDVNVSMMEEDAKELGTRVEVKNINSFSSVYDAIVYEINRQSELINSGRGDEIVQETRRFDEESGTTKRMRSKEDAIDYKYFVEPNIPKYKVSKEWVEEISSCIPELPLDRKKRYIKEYGLSDYDANIIIKEKDYADYFEKCISLGMDAKESANWIIVNILAYINKLDISINDLFVTPEKLKVIIDAKEKGAISSKQAKEIFVKVIEDKKEPIEYIKDNSQISDKEELIKIIDDILLKSESQIEAYKAGRSNLFDYFVGQVMKNTRGKANPVMTKEILNEKLNG